MLAVNNRNYQVVEVLLQAKANINHTNIEGFTPLLNACYNGYDEIAIKLMLDGANVNQQTPEGFTPLMYATSYGNKNIVNALILAGADVTLKNKAGFSAIDYATSSLSIIDALHKAIKKKSSQKYPLDKDGNVILPPMRTPPIPKNQNPSREH